MDRYGTTPREFAAWPDHTMPSTERLALLIERAAETPSVARKFISDCLMLRNTICDGARDRDRAAYSRHAAEGTTDPWYGIDLSDYHALMDISHRRVGTGGSGMRDASDMALRASRVRYGTSAVELGRQIELVVLLLENNQSAARPERDK